MLHFKKIKGEKFLKITGVFVIFVCVLWYLYTNTTEFRCRTYRGPDYVPDGGQGCTCRDGLVAGDIGMKFGPNEQSGLGEYFDYTCYTPIDLCKITKGNHVISAEYDKKKNVLRCHMSHL